MSYNNTEYRLIFLNRLKRFFLTFLTDKLKDKYLVHIFIWTERKPKRSQNDRQIRKLLGKLYAH